MEVENKVVGIGAHPPAPVPEPTEAVETATCEPAELREPISAVCEKISRLRNRALLVLATSMIDSDLVERLCRFRKKLQAAASRKEGAVDVLLNSPGGELNSCFLIAQLLGRWLGCSWEALVPSYASSGATLICLGSSSIVMSERAQLGPLDPQQRLFDADRSSPFEAFRGMQELFNFALNCFENGVEFMVERKVSPEKALEAAGDLAIRMVEPIIAKIEPCDIGILAIDSAMAIDYCARIARPADPARRTQREVDPAALVRGLPGHEYAIDADAARALNFHVCDATPELEDLFDELRPLLTSASCYIGLAG